MHEEKKKLKILAAGDFHGDSKTAKKLAEKIVQLGEGRLYIVKNLEELDKIILEDYYSVY